MLVATVSLGFIAPIATQASDFDIQEMNSYVSKKSSSRKQKLFNSNSFNDELATQKDKSSIVENKAFEAGSFSDTTTLDTKVVFTLGAINSPVNASGNAIVDESAKATYMLQNNLNTSFTGDDNLYVRLKSGNAGDWQTAKKYGTYLSSSKGNSDLLKIDKIWYSFPVAGLNGDHTIWIGPQIENYYMHATTPSIYQPVTKQFTLGGNGAAYGASTSPGIGWSYKADNGFAISSNVNSASADTTKGFLTRETKSSWATQIGYTKPTYSASIMVNKKYQGWTDTYYSTTLGGGRGTTAAPLDSTNIGLRGWWRPEDSGSAVPSISLGYDTSSVDGQDQDTSAYFLGLTWQDAFTPDDKIGLAFGQPQTRDDETTDPFAWEVYYSYAMNDSVTITPAIFGASDRYGDSGKDPDKGTDLLGAVVETTFKF